MVFLSPVRCKPSGRERLKMIDTGPLPPKVRILGPGKLPNLANQGYWEVARC
jgi:hypothetical protein